MARSKDEPNKLLGRLVRAYYLEAAEARSTREVAWEDSYNRSDPSYIDKTKVKGPFYLKTPYSYRLCEMQAAQLMEASEANGKWVSVRANLPETSDYAPIVENALENQFRCKTSDLFGSNEAALERYGRMGIRYGNSDVEIIYGEEEGKCKVIPHDPFDVFRDWKHGRWFIIRSLVTVAEMGDIAATLSAHQFQTQQVPVTDPMTGQPSLDPMTGQPVMEEVQIDLGPRDGGVAERAFKKLVAAVKSGEGTGYVFNEGYGQTANTRQSNIGKVGGSDDQTDATYLSPKEDPYNARVTLLRYYETRRDGVIGFVVPNLGGAGEDLVFRNEKNPYKVCPVVPFIPRPVDNEQYGYGLPEVVGHSQEAMDLFFRAQCRYYVRVADSAVLVRKSLRLRSEYLKSQSGITIPVDDPQTDVRYMDPPANPMMHQAGFGLVKNVADLGTGSSEQQRGQTGGSNTATEAAIALQSATLTDRMLFRQWRRSISQIGHVMLAIMRVHVTEEQAIPLFGGGVQTFLRLKPEYLAHDYTVTFGGDVRGNTPQIRAMGYRGIATTYGPMGVVDASALARADLRELGEVDPDQFLIRKDEPPSRSPRHEHLALFDFGHEIEVSPKDDHMAHIIAHMKEGQKRAGHPAIPLLIAHVQIHHQALAMMQQQQATASSAGPEGAQPFQPGQAGQPGQPAAYTPATSGVNAQRQMSNEQANGGAPGPVAPRRLPMLNGGGR